MGSQPRVSVCIPTYNHEKYIAACIDSVLRQTFSDFEIIVTDDGSTDGTADVVKSFSDNRIKLFRLDRNCGPSTAANKNFHEARGEYLCPLASDDLFHPEKLERQMNFLESNPGIGVAFSYMRYVDEGGTPIPNHFAYQFTDVENCSREVWLRRFFFEGNHLAAPTAMIRREVLDRVGELDGRLLQTQDFDLWIRICLHYEISVLPERLSDYRVRANHQNTSANEPAKQAQTHWELAKVMERFCLIEDEDFFLRIFPDARDQHPHLPLRAKLAVQAVNARARATQIFGLELMYKLLADREMADALEKFGYDYPAFNRLVREADAFNVEPHSKATERLWSLKGEYDWMADQARRWEQEYEKAKAVALKWKKAHDDLLRKSGARVSG